jgi:signal transduction histidine kinase
MAMLKVLSDQAAIAIRNYNQQRDLINAERTQLVPDMAHILRSPAALISMFVAHLERELNKPELNVDRLKQYITLTRRETFTIDTMSRTLAAVAASRVESQEREDVSLVNFLKNRLQSCYFGDQRVTMENALLQEFDLPLTKLECLYIEIIVLNIVHNAFKYSPHGEIVRITCYNNNSDICISVLDKGPGISPEDVHRIFEPAFHRIAPGWTEGTGLGLFTVKSLLDKLGWSCEVVSEVGKGAEFIVRIPAGWRNQT